MCERERKGGGEERKSIQPTSITSFPSFSLSLPWPRSAFLFSLPHFFPLFSFTHIQTHTYKYFSRFLTFFHPLFLSIFLFPPSTLKVVQIFHEKKRKKNHLQSTICQIYSSLARDYFFQIPCKSKKKNRKHC